MTLFYIAIAAWLIMSVVAWCVYAYDKKIAGTGKRRIPERTLLLLAFAMGAPGAYAVMLRLRHKTKHKQFTIPVPVFLALQTALIVFIFIKSI